MFNLYFFFIYLFIPGKNKNDRQSEMHYNTATNALGIWTRALLHIIYIISHFNLIITKEIYESSSSNVLIRSPRKKLSWHILTGRHKASYPWQWSFSFCAIYRRFMRLCEIAAVNYLICPPDHSLASSCPLIRNHAACRTLMADEFPFSKSRSAEAWVRVTGDGQGRKIREAGSAF